MTTATIAPAILQHYPALNEAQRATVGHLDGPLLVIAGPGSGKTFSIVLRALNLLLLERATPRQLLLCTFTEKAAFEMRDRLSAAARKVGYRGDLSELTASTIHGFCNRALDQQRHRTELGHGFATFDELTQLLFLWEHFDDVIGPAENDRFLRRWKTRWTAIEGARSYFDKITEELVDAAALAAAADPFLSALGAAYARYERALVDANRTDFAHLQRHVLDLLRDTRARAAFARDLRYVMVDEYQDTNYIQEQLLLDLAAGSRNLCVVGDEDTKTTCPTCRLRSACILIALRTAPTRRASGGERMALSARGPNEERSETVAIGHKPSPASSRNEALD